MRHLARGLAVLFLLFALGLGQQVAYAAGTVTIQVTTSLDGNDPSPGDGVCNTNATDPARGACSLRAAIQTASSEPTGISVIVSVPASSQHYYLTLSPGPLQISSQSGNLISVIGQRRSDVVIDGSQFPGGTQDLIVTSPAVLRALTIAGGNAGPGAGGGVLDTAQISLDNVQITRNTAILGGGLYEGTTGSLTMTNASVDHNAAFGSSLFCSPLTCTTTNATGGGLYLAGPARLSYMYVGANTSQANAGGIEVNSTQLVTGSYLTVAGNSASNVFGPGYGGGIEDSTPATFPGTTPLLEIAHSSFSTNVAPLAGGAIFNNQSNVQVSSSTFTGNVAGSLDRFSGEGGAIYSGSSSNGGSVELDTDTFTGNVAGQYGGALDEYVATVTGSVFRTNQAGTQPWPVGTESMSAGLGRGGAIYNRDGSLDLENSTVASNTAGQLGGGVGEFGNGLVMSHDVVSNNAVGGASACDGKGGGLYSAPGFTDEPNDQIHSTTFSGNTASPGTTNPAVRCSSSSGPNTGACNSTGGGLVLGLGQDIVDSGTRVEGNRACDGAGMYVETAGVTLTDSLVMANNANAHGGGLYLAEGSGGAHLVNSRVIGNHASVQTGGIYNGAGSPVTLSNGSVVSGNAAPPPCPNVLTPCS